MMIVVVLIDKVDLEDDIEEKVVVDRGGGGKGRNIQYFHCYEVGRGIPCPIFVTNLILLI